MKTISLVKPHLDVNPGESTQRDTSKVDFSLLDVAFRISNNPRLRLKSVTWQDKATDYLDHAITRSSTDLKSHVQRVYLQIEKQDIDGSFGALLDLFVSLNQQGRPLRQRMLEAARNVLSESHYAFLESRLDRGIVRTDSVPSSHTSLLTQYFSGTNQLVTKQLAPSQSYGDPLDEARDYIEYGQIDEAITVLESAIVKAPDRTEIHLDLLEIYKRTNACKPFQEMWHRLDSSNNPVTDAWQELAVFFGQEI